MIDCGLIAQAIDAYDPDAQEASIVKAEEQRAQFLAHFPKEGWPAMTLDRYALGQAEHPDNFCRWMEFVTSELGSIRGGNAKKHLIYFQAAAGEWWFDQKLFSSVDEAWQAVHRGFVDAIGFAEAGDWSSIGSIDALHSGPALVNKMLSVYFPDQLLPINSSTHLRHFLRELGEPQADDQSLGTTSLNRLLLDNLRACPELDGWTTKQMERLLYGSELDPFIGTAPIGPIEDVPGFIAKTLAEAGVDRLEWRRQSEDQARKLLDDFAGRMTEEQGRELLRLFNADLDNGQPKRTRFSPAFVGQTANGLMANLDLFNMWTERVWRGTPEEAAEAVGELLSDRKSLPSAGSSYPTMLMYLRSPETSAVWSSMPDRGLQRLTNYKPTKSPGSGKSPDYALYCDAAQRLMSDFEVPPELLDFLLAAAGRPQEPLVPTVEATGVWLFQANPKFYAIDQALSEVEELSWTLRQYAGDVHAGDRVYLWRAGDNAGIVAIATVLTEPTESAADPNDPYILDKTKFAKSLPTVQLRIDTVLPSAILRSSLLDHPILGELGVIKFANATNYRVLPEEDQALRDLIESEESLALPVVTEQFAQDLHLPVSWLQNEIVDLLTEKKQVIFYGPPGTGKTLVAQRIAAHLVRDGGGSELIQFHPAYSYEDFFEGYRPAKDDDGGLTYILTPGPLRRIAERAAQDPSRPYILIIDEINRGNVPKIFGELLFLLEYRDARIPLQYSSTPFGLPRNLFVIATMNTADRSIALVDTALRRRFYFVAFMPRAKPVNEVLRLWLEGHELNDEPARLLKELNNRIASDEVAIGPSYFITADGSAPDLDRVWRHAIIPLLEDYYYGTKTASEVVSEFGLKAVRQGLSVSGSPAETDPAVVAEESGEGSPIAS